MFERYSEKARRMIFFARYEASQLGGMSIEPEHLLLGLLREDPGLLERLLPTDYPVRALQEEISGRTRKEEKPQLPTSAEMPLSDGSKRVLTYASEEADRLLSTTIDPPHILLGLLRVEETPSSSILQAHGLELSSLRNELAGVPTPSSTSRDSGKPSAQRRPIVPDEETAERIAEAIWIPIVGQDIVEGQKPLQVSLDNTIWTVRGTLPEGSHGNQLVAKIWMMTGEVYYLDPLP